MTKTSGQSAMRYSALPAAALCAVTVCGSAAALILPAALGRTLDLLLAQQDRSATARWTLLCGCLLAAVALCDALQTWLTGTTDARTTAWLRRRLIRRVLAAGPATAERFGVGDVVARCTGNAAAAGTAPASVAALLAALATPIGAVVALGLTDPWLMGVYLLGAPLLIALLRAFTRAGTDCLARYQQAQAAIAGPLAEAVGGARTIAAAGTQARESARILRALPELSRHGHRMWHIQGRATAQASALVPLLQTVVVAVGGLRLAGGRLSVGDLLAASRYAVLAAGIGVIVSRLDALVRARTAAARTDALLDLPSLAYGSRRLPAGPGRLELRGVSVARGGGTVLRELDLVVPGGTSLAVVGRSGSGKSLLAAVAGRLADPDRGVVTLDGVPLDELDRAALRAGIGYAFERPALFGETIADAIGYAAPEADLNRVTAAARAACADGFVKLLPHGYRTPLTDAPLSGGEAQRLGLARAFAHAGRLLILDDATSSLDTVTERHVTGALMHHTGDRTRLVIAHRAATAARADTVAWLDGGRIRALAPHRELWRLPEYRAAFAEEDG
ncbi:ABC transporter ATP-binding protein [Streptomyces sp. Ru72]|uniref:ABC transporter transmembrane domain-containing protein n=1 Tax=Streptomyces sp. Ru72 TaxID=2080747 RepID=UPI000CDD1384|nr:ABC transporter ATP-binding protein [Streptomyces sp. Ru72]POX45284.1 ABC transporter ATP-binding protein [Streptomyces sp. Ru72]